MATRTVKVPKRAEGLLAQRVGDEVVVVDSTTQQATALSGLSADIWEASATGSWTGHASHTEVDRVVAELLDAGLLYAPSHTSRRRVLQGAGALAVAGGVMAIGIPSAAAASSGTVTFSVGSHLLTLPAGPVVIQFTLVAGGGGKDIRSGLFHGGSGGAVSGTMTYNGPGGTLGVVVGGAGGNGAAGHLAQVVVGAGAGGNGGSGGSGGGGKGGAGGAILGVKLPHVVLVQVGSDWGGGGGGGASALVANSTVLAVAGGGGGGSSLSSGTDGSASGTSPAAIGAGSAGGDGAPGIIELLEQNVGGGGGGGGAQPGVGGAKAHGGSGGQGFYAANGNFSFSGVTTSTNGADGFGLPGVEGIASFTGQGISAG